MKSIITTILISLTVIIQLSAQNTNSLFTGRWYSSNVNKSEKTLDFKRETNDSIYLEWNFRGKDSLFISKCQIEDHYKNSKDQLIIATTSGIKRWNFDKLNKEIEVKSSKEITSYVILSADNNHITLEKKSSSIIPRKEILYFKDTNINIDISQKDTLIFFAKKGKRGMPNINLKETNQFTFSYNIKLDTITKRLPDGVFTQQIVEDSEKIHGIWRSNNPNRHMQLKFSANQINNYKVYEDAGRIYFVKKP